MTTYTKAKDYHSSINSDFFNAYPDIKKWLPLFEQPLNEVLEKYQLDLSRQKKEPPYSPYNFENHLEDLVKLIDKLISLRREFNSTVEQGVKQALEYKLFLENLNVQKSLEIKEWTSDRLKQNADDQDALLSLIHI